MPGKILAFDSGIGGLSIVGALRRVLPDVAIDYLADNAVYPYGELADDVLVSRLEALLDSTIPRLDPDVIVIACNTASTVALDAMRAKFRVPFVGCVPPIKWAASLSRTRTVGLLATRATVRRPYLRDLQSRFAPDCTLLAHGASHLADIAEAVFRGQTVDQATVALELGDLFSQVGGDAIDVVCIGCTHYSFLLNKFQELSRPGIVWLDPAAAVARQVATVLERLDVRDITSPGDAWFTATPKDMDQLTTAITDFGYSGIRICGG